MEVYTFAYENYDEKLDVTNEVLAYVSSTRCFRKVHKNG